MTYKKQIAYRALGQAVIQVGDSLQLLVNNPDRATAPTALRDASKFCQFLGLDEEACYFDAVACYAQWVVEDAKSNPNRVLDHAQQLANFLKSALIRLRMSCEGAFFSQDLIVALKSIGEKIGQEFKRPVREDDVEPLGEVAGHDTVRRFARAIDHVQRTWGQSAHATVPPELTGMVRELAEKSPILKSATFSKLAEALLEMTQAFETGRKSSPQEEDAFWLNGAIALTLMRDAVERAGQGQGHVVTDCAGKVLRAMEGGAASASADVVSEGLLHATRGQAMLHAAKWIGGITTEVEKKVNSILERQGVGIHIAAAEVLANRVGDKLAKQMDEVAHVLATLGRLRAANLAWLIADEIRYASSWEGAMPDPLVTGIASLNLYANTPSEFVSRDLAPEMVPEAWREDDSPLVEEAGQSDTEELPASQDLSAEMATEQGTAQQGQPEQAETMETSSDQEGDVMPTSIFDEPEAEIVQTPESLQEIFIKAGEGVVDSVDAHVLPTALDETESLMQSIHDCLFAWSSGKASYEAIRGMRRAIHTMKGALRLAGMMRAGAILHVMEDEMESWGETVPDSKIAQPFAHAIDAVLEMAQDAGSQLRMANTPMAATAEHEVGQPLSPEVSVAEQFVSVDESKPGVSGPSESANSLPQPVSNPATMRQSTGPETIRVPLDVVSRIATASSEASILHYKAKTDLSGAIEALKGLTTDLDRLSKLMSELETQAEIRIQAARSSKTDDRFDPLELDRFTRLQEISRSLSENIADVRGREQELRAVFVEIEDTESRRGMLSEDLQFEASRLMVVPFANQTSRIERVIRQACAQTSKKAELAVLGNAEVPGTVIDRLMPAVEHVLRNAITHGIEKPIDREALGKTATGRVSVSAAPGEHEFLLIIRDDGKGIDPAEIIRKARKKGLASFDRAYSVDEAYELMFYPGFTTADEVTELSGRGIGLDAVRNIIQELGGKVTVTSEPGKWTEFRMAVPTDIASMSVITVSAGGYQAMIPAPLVDRIVTIHGPDVVRIREAGVFNLEGLECTFMDFRALLGDVAQAPQAYKGYAYLIVLGVSSGRPMGLLVDEVGQIRKVIVRPLGPHIAKLPGLVAGSIAGDGSPTLILNPLRMPVLGAAEQDKGNDRQLIMVVDDSPTVRMVMGRFLRRHGFEVLEARDGVDALEMLGNGVAPDAFLLDIEMPRMDGFELIKSLRRNDGFLETPILVITSRIGQKHRDHAFRIGVNEYIGKPYEESEILSLLRKYVRQGIRGLVN